MPGHLTVAAAASARTSRWRSRWSARPRSWTRAASAEHTKRNRAGTEPQKTIRVNDEAWRALPIAGLGELLPGRVQAGTPDRCAALDGLHRLSDLDAAGDEGTRQQALVKGLLAETGTVIVYRQHPEEAPRAPRRSDCRSTEARRIVHYPQGVALWRIGGRSYEVRHVRSAREEPMTATDARDGEP